MSKTFAIRAETIATKCQMLQGCAQRLRSRSKALANFTVKMFAKCRMLQGCAKRLCSPPKALANCIVKLFAKCRTLQGCAQRLRSGPRALANCTIMLNVCGDATTSKGKQRKTRLNTMFSGGANIFPLKGF